MILVDSNVWIDLIQADPQWLEWSLAQLQRARAKGALIINPVIYAELAPNYDDMTQLDRFLKALKVSIKPLSRQAAYGAGHAFLRYRQQRGAKTGVLPDFFIGAQALAEGYTLLTRDTGRYKTYFPQLKLIAPN